MNAGSLLYSELPVCPSSPPAIEPRSHPDGDPGGDDPREQLRQFKKDTVRVMITDLSSDLSKMMTEFEGAYNDKDASAPGAFKLTRLKLHSDPTADVDEFVKAVSEDIKSTLMVSTAFLEL